MDKYPPVNRKPWPGLLRNPDPDPSTSPQDLPADLKRRVQCLTIGEAKGQAFDAVVLVNFFSDSEYHRWAVLEEYTASDACVAWRRAQAQCAGEVLAPGPGAEARPHRALHRDPHGRDVALGAELKQLYVAVTRCRRLLYFVEEVRGVLWGMCRGAGGWVTVCDWTPLDGQGRFVVVGRHNTTCPLAALGVRPTVCGCRPILVGSVGSAHTLGGGGPLIR